MRNDGEVYKSVVAKVSSGAAKREDAEMRERLVRTNTLEEAGAQGHYEALISAGQKDTNEFPWCIVGRELLAVLAKWAAGSPPWPVPLMNFPCYPRGQHTEVNGAVGSGESRAVGCDES